MKGRILKNWKRRLSLIISLLMIVTSCNVYPVQAASDVFSADFEKTDGTFKNFKDANVQLSNAVSVTDGEQQNEKEEDTSEDALLTTKVTMKMEKEGYTDAFVQLKAFLSKTSKEYISSFESIQVVLSVDKVEALSGGTPVAKLFFQPNTTWNWCASDEVTMTAGKDYTINLPISAIKWGTGDKEVGAFGIQLANFKEGMDVNVSVKSIEMLGKISSMAADVKSGEATLKYVSQYDITSAEIDMTPFLSVTTKEEISKATSIEAVFSVDTAEDFRADKTPIAKMYFMPNTTWAWATGTDVAVKAGEDIKVSIPIANIQWGNGDIAVGQCGIQLNNFKEGTVKYTVKSFKIVTGNEVKETPKAEVKDTGAAKTGENFLYVSGRKNTISGACVELTDCCKAGKTYNITAWVKNIDAETDFIRLNYGRNAETVGTMIAAVKAVQGEWVQLKAVLAVPESAKKVMLSFASMNTVNDFGIDDIVISETDQSTTTEIKNHTVTNQDVVDGKVTFENLAFHNLTIDASVGEATVILNNVTVAGKLSLISGGATKIELNNTVVNQFDAEKGESKSAEVQSFAVADSIPTIVIGPGSSILRFLTGADVVLTQDEKSLLENIVVKPGANNGIDITLKNVKCNVIIEANKTSPIAIVLENAQLNKVSVNSPIARGQVDISGDAGSNIATFNMDDSDGVTASINAPVQTLNVNSDNATVNINSNVGAFIMAGNQANISMDTNAVVGTLTANGNNAKIVSKGSVASLLINGNNTEATVTENTKVEIKEGVTGSIVKGSTNIVDNNPKSASIIPYVPPKEIIKATTNAVLAKNVSKSLKAIKDPAYEDSSCLYELNDYLSNYLYKEFLEKYERIEIKLTVDNVTNYSDANKGKVTLFTVGTEPDWHWAEFSATELTANNEVTLKINTSEIEYSNHPKLFSMGLKFSQFAPNTAFICSIASIKLIASDTAPDDKPADKASEDLVILSTAQTGSATIKDDSWSGTSTIDITPYLTDASKLKNTINLYDYLEVKVAFGSGTAYTSQTPSAKLFTQDSTDWKWADGGDTAVVADGTTIVRLPVSKIAWGSSGSSTKLGQAGLQIYGYAVGQNISYTIESIKLIAPASIDPNEPVITGDYVEIKKTDWNVSGTLDLMSKFNVSKDNVSKYEKIKVVLDINTIILNGTSAGTAKLFTMDNVGWKWASSAEVEVKSNSTITLELPTSSIVWGDDGNSTALGSIGIQFMGAEAGTKIGYKMVSAELTGLKEVPQTPVTELTVVASVSGSAIMGNYISDFTAKSVATKDALSQYKTIEVKLTIHSFTPDGYSGVQIYTNTPKGKWTSKGDVAVATGNPLTMTMLVSDINWDTETSLGMVGISFYGVKDVSYTIEYIKLIK